MGFDLMLWTTTIKEEDEGLYWRKFSKRNKTLDLVLFKADDIDNGTNPQYVNNYDGYKGDTTLGTLKSLNNFDSIAKISNNYNRREVYEIINWLDEYFKLIEDNKEEAYKYKDGAIPIHYWGEY